MQIGGLEFNVQVAGEGPAFIWAHGLTASMVSEDLLDIFEWDKFPEDIQLVRYDARGHGKTEPSLSPADYHWRNLAKDMISIADALEINEFVVGGQSMGCATTIYAGLIAPERVKGMVLMNPPTAWETRAAQGDFYRELARVGGMVGGAKLAAVMSGDLDRLVPGWLAEARREQVLGMLEGLKPMKPETLSTLFTGAASTDLPSREEVTTIDSPALILGWTDDPTHPLETAIELDRLMPQSTLAVAEAYSELEQWPQLIREFVAVIG